MEEKREKLKPVINKDEGLANKDQTFMSRLLDVFLPCDKDHIGEYLLWEVVIPGARDMLMDILGNADIGTSRRHRNRPTDYAKRYQYDNDRRHRTERSTVSDRDRDLERNRQADYRDVVLTHRDDAEEVIDQLRYRIDKTGAASIADLFDLVDMQSTPSQNDYGWTNKGAIALRRVSNGWLIDVERAEYLL